jgi:hypothetical protein
VHLKKRRQPSPDGGQRPGVTPVDLLQDREQPPLLVMIVKHQLGDIHQSSPCTENSGALVTKQSTMLRRTREGGGTRK